MIADTTFDRFLAWAATRTPYRVSVRLRWRLEDRRLDRVMAERVRVAQSLRGHVASRRSRRRRRGRHRR